MAVAVLVSALLAFALGWIWYAPGVFGNIWKEAIGKKEGEINETLAKYLVSFAGWLTAAFIYGFLISHGFINGIRDYLFLSFALWGAFMLPAKAHAMMWGNFSTKLIWIDGGYFLSGYLIFALVFRLLA